MARRRGFSRRYGYYDAFPRQATVGEMQARAQREVKRLSTNGEALCPVVGKGRTIAATFWGRAWCTNLDSYADYSNRLPRGRSYLAHGQVLDLRVEKGEVRALVAGSRPQPYSVTVTIRPLDPQRWKQIVQACVGKVDSMIELLQGRLPDSVMQAVTAHATGLFPSPSEIRFECSCPDWASMCKHVAASLYGIGARLDDAPELLFVLRGVEPAELITSGGAAKAITAQAEHKAMKADSDELSSLFGIDLQASAADPEVQPSRLTAARTTTELETAAAVANPLPAPVRTAEPRRGKSSAAKKVAAPTRQVTPKTPASKSPQKPAGKSPQKPTGARGAAVSRPPAEPKRPVARTRRSDGKTVVTRDELLARKVPGEVIEFWIEQGLLPSDGGRATFVLSAEIASRVAKFERMGRRSVRA